jgi:crossover junction endodeoxyribonuclease RuvC
LGIEGVRRSEAAVDAGDAGRSRSADRAEVAAPQLVVGIDPGLTGALALLRAGRLIAIADMPVMVKGKGTSKVRHEINPAGLAQVLRSWVPEERLQQRLRIVVEVVNSMPRAGPPQPCPVCKRDRKAMGSSSVFSMGDSTGCIRGVLAALGFSIEWVSPATWKAHFKLAGGPLQKEAARAQAIRLYPEADLARKKDHNRAEAILIARWYADRSMPLTGDPF